MIVRRAAATDLSAPRIATAHTPVEIYICWLVRGADPCVLRGRRECGRARTGVVPPAPCAVDTAGARVMFGWRDERWPGVEGVGDAGWCADRTDPRLTPAAADKVADGRCAG